MVIAVLVIEILDLKIICYLYFVIWDLSFAICDWSTII
jgi:hypothetical protein